MFDYEIKYKRGSTNVETDMLSKNLIAHYIRPVSLRLVVKEIMEMQAAGKR